MREWSLDPRAIPPRLRELVLRALRQSTRPEQVALTLALGHTIGISPVYGTTTTTSIVVALALRLNLPLMQAALWAVWPLQLLLILPFVRLGERMWGHPGLPLSREELLAIFRQGPGAVVGELGWALAHAFSAWLGVALLLVPALYLAYLPLVRQLARRRETRLDAEETHPASAGQEPRPPRQDPDDGAGP